ncbi:CLUMA_CG018653, isoform A [Clunio marinus]|uniref:CLUMA_CG018653, isoform A n=1 Tax=Clunio marinus TaxID=568069 RepID=A0A1J1J1H3_9DIPT|nr:CLUMA_CG018653, isoform A [Clunio marinus]
MKREKVSRYKSKDVLFILIQDNINDVENSEWQQLHARLYSDEYHRVYDCFFIFMNKRVSP